MGGQGDCSLVARRTLQRYIAFAVLLFSIFAHADAAKFGVSSQGQQPVKVLLNEAKTSLSVARTLSHQFGTEIDQNADDAPAEKQLKEFAAVERELKQGLDEVVAPTRPRSDATQPSTPLTRQQPLSRDFLGRANQALHVDALSHKARHSLATTAIHSSDHSKNVQLHGSNRAPPEYQTAGQHTRPGTATGQDVDVVYFGLYGKTFYGADMKAQEFTIDSVVTLHWTDSRAVSLVPDGQDELTLSLDVAQRRIWMPQVEIANTIAEKFELIFASVSIGKDGKVTQVQRSLAVVKNKFPLDNYPFDEQTLRFSISSTKYMSSEVKLEPSEDATISGLRKSFFDGEPYIKKDFKVHAFDDVDGTMKKSRGNMDIIVERKLDSFRQNFLYPSILYLAIGCLVFWLPFSHVFVTPRIALSVLVILAYTSSVSTARSELPAGSPYNWLDLIRFTVLLHMFVVLFVNLFTEMTYHSFGCTVTAAHMNFEMKVMAPLLAALPMLSIFAASTNPDGPFGLKTLTILTPVLFAVVLISYMACASCSLSAEMARNKRAADLKLGSYGGTLAPEYGGGTVGPLASSESLAPSP